MAVSVLMVQDGAWWSTAPDGSATLYFIVNGLQMNQVCGEQANSAGLPKAGEDHPFSPGRFAEEPTVVEVINSTASPELSVKVRIDYRPVNYSGLATILSSSGDSELVAFALPLVRPLPDTRNIIDWHETTRARVEYRDTRNVGGYDIKRASLIAAQNAGKVYLLNVGGFIQIPYKLRGVTAWRDRGNRSFITTVFYSLAPVPALAANTYGAHAALPELGNARDYFIEWNYTDGSVTVTPEVWTETSFGENLPWM